MARVGAHPPRLDRNYLAGSVPSQPPAELVDESMVASTQETSIGNLGLAAVHPVDEVMAITPGGWAVAARASAVLVASGERAQHRRRERTGAAADVDRLRPAVQQDAGHGEVACDAADHRGVDRLPPIELTGGGAWLLGQRFDRGGHGQMSLLAADVGEGAGVEALAAEVDQGVRAALAARRLIVGLKWVLASADCGAHDCAAFTVQLTAENIDTVHHLGDVEIAAGEDLFACV